MEFNYRHIYHNKRLAVYHEYARLILTSIYKILKGCYDGDETLDNVYLLEKDYPMLGTHFLERLKKYSDIGRAVADRDPFGNSFGNEIIYHIDQKDKVQSEREYRRACIEYIAGMTDTYAEKIFDELTTF